VPDGWDWIERTSWLVAVIGLPLGLIQLAFVLREQRRITRELARQPQLDLGFHPVQEVSGKRLLSKETKIKVTWNPNEQYSNPTQVEFHCQNLGERSARNVLFNFVLPIEFAHLTGYDIGKQSGALPIINVTVSADQRPVIVARWDQIHPRDSARIGVIINIPRVSEATIEAEASMDDRASVVENLRVVFEAQEN
jgi:hypothetical protein